MDNRLNNADASPRITKWIPVNLPCEQTKNSVTISSIMNTPRLPQSLSLARPVRRCRLQKPEITQPVADSERQLTARSTTESTTQSTTESTAQYSALTGSTPYLVVDVVSSFNKGYAEIFLNLSRENRQRIYRQLQIEIQDFKARQGVGNIAVSDEVRLIGVAYGMGMPFYDPRVLRDMGEHNKVNFEKLRSAACHFLHALHRRPEFVIPDGWQPR
ncbi:hypothetical protein [Rouxiella badensis]|uniref:hypothetical protein n=1 Tax=Rouxiella badensis TaxID=1646377 RepID=UPI003C5ED8CA